MLLFLCALLLTVVRLLCIALLSCVYLCYLMDIILLCVYCCLTYFIWNETNWCHYFIRILLDLYMFRAHRPIFRRVRTAVHTTIGSYSFCAALFACSVFCVCDNTQSTRTDRHRNWTNGCVNSCTNSPEDGPVGPKHAEIQQYTNKILTLVGFHSIRWKDARYKKLKSYLSVVCHSYSMSLSSTLCSQ